MILKQIDGRVTKYNWLQNEVITINDLVLVARNEIQDQEWILDMNEKIIIVEDMLRKYDGMDGRRKIVLGLLKESMFFVEKELREKMNYTKEYQYFEEGLKKIKETKENKKEEKENYKKIN